MRCGSLFSGIGGFDLAMQRAGIETAWTCEIDEPCNQVLAKHFPGVTRYRDVKELKASDLARVDVLCGGWPCQDLSVAGNRAGLVGERSGLFYEVARLASEIAPQWLLLENVPGLLSSNEGRDMGIVLGTLSELGYGWAYRVLDARYFGVPQRRRRVFIVGCLGDARRAAEVLFESESCERDLAPSGAQGKEVAGTLGGGSGRRGWCDDTDRATFIADTVRSHPRPGSNSSGGTVVTGGAQQDQFCTPDGVAPTLAHASNAHGGHHQPKVVLAGSVSNDSNPVSSEGEDPIGALKIGSGLAIPSAPAIVMRWREGKPGGGKGALLSEDQSLTLATSNDQVAFLSENQRAEVRLTDTSFSLTTSGGKPGQGYPAAMVGSVVRRLTPLECERLQGFPDNWTEGHADSARYRMLGNAVAVPVVEWIARRLAA